MNGTNIGANARAASEKKFDIKKLAMLGLFTAFGYVFIFVFHFKVSFLTLDFKDVFITIAGFVCGPLAAVGVSLAETLLELITVSDTGFWGALMNFFGSTAFAVTASLIYKYNKSLTGAVVGLATSVFSMTAIMLVMNLVITPIYTGTDVKTVAGMILPLLLPFNLIKALLNAAVTFIIYKPVSHALKSAKIIPNSGDTFKIGKSTIIGFAAAIAVIAVSIVVMVTLLGGSFSWK